MDFAPGCSPCSGSGYRSHGFCLAGEASFGAKTLAGSFFRFGHSSWCTTPCAWQDSWLHLRQYTRVRLSCNPPASAAEGFRLRKSQRVRVGLLLCFVSWTAQTDAQDASALEKQAADAVAHLVQQIRSQNRLPKLERMDDAVLHDKACASAKEANISSKMSTEVTVRHGAVTLSQIAYSTTDPGNATSVMESWVKEKDSRDPRRFAVGACFVASQENPGGRYWIEVSTYMSSTKSFLYRTGSGIARLWSR